jgi:hypothetical protein
MLQLSIIKRFVIDLHLGDTIQSHDGQWHTITHISPFWHQRTFSIVELDKMTVRVYNHSTTVLIRDPLPIG